MLKPEPVTTNQSGATSASAKKAREKEPLNPWHAALAKYRTPSVARSLWQLTNTLVLLGLSWGFTFERISAGSWMAVFPGLLAAGLVVRLFVLQHDCGHRSFMPTAKGCDRIGVWLGILTLTPYHTWRRLHALHHATSGDLDRRGKGGEILLLTVAEYQALPWFKKLGYRLYRNPFVLLVLGPTYQFLIKQRFAFDLPKEWKRERRSVYFTNIGMATAAGLLIWAFGWQTFLLGYLPVVAVASTVGVWLFYVQHQYEEGYFEHHESWDYTRAALEGSSYFRMPKVLQWMTANIGIHHIHHLDCKIPNYYLQQCMNEQPGLAARHTVTVADALRLINHKIWDEKSARLLTWREYKHLA